MSDVAPVHALTPSPLPLRGRGAIRFAGASACALATPGRPSPAQRERGGGEGRTLAWVAIAASCALAACAVGPDYQRPALDLPAGWRLGPAEASEITNAAWWEAFKDPVLSRLLADTIAGSLDLKAAVARVDQARAQYGLARSALFPQIGTDASAQRQRASRSTVQGIFIPPGQQNYTTYNLDLSATYEIDVWGRLRRATESARAQLLASDEGRRTVVLTLVTNMADAYILLLALDDELAIAQRTLESRREVLKLQRARFEGGVAPESDYRQAESEFQIAANAVPLLQRQIAQQENLINVLAGRKPGTVERGGTLHDLAVPPVPAGLPSDLLERRPDVRQAEQELIAANADIGVARAAYFPRISLTGLLGYQSAQLVELTRSASGAWTAGAGLTQALFTGGALRSQVELAQARQRELVATYQGAVNSALRDVNDALIARTTLEQQRAEQEKNVAALTRLLKLAQRRYQEGAAIYLEVATAEQSLFDAEISLDTLRALLFQSYADLYRAFGGGWIQTAEAMAPQAAGEAR
ncbi:MAG TPA: efflux transporter outer membrane subunit [Burkholderiaceae bacterium]|nr:efflux transporter outer membrane subunit [Burkholderiaceae bacterium]